MRVLHEPGRDGVMRAWSVIAAVVGSVAFACAGDGGDSSFTVRDSAGVQIVENGATGLWTPATAWTIPDTPALSIGGDETDSTTMFSLVQSTTRLGDGRIVVANYRTRQLRLYDANGRFIRAVGKLGQGPGEFDWLGRALRTEGDSLILWDPNNARLSVLDSGGRLVRSVPLRAGQGISFPEPFGRASDGSLIGRTGPLGVSSGSAGAVRNPAIFVRYGPDLVAIDTIAQRPGTERFIQPSGRGMSGYGPPFGRSTVAAFSRDRLYVGTADRYDVSVIDLDGREVRSIRAAIPTRKVTDADVARQREAFLDLARDPARRQVLENVYAAMRVPSTMPAYRGLHVDRVGNLWVEDYRVTDDDPPRWTVFDSTGRMLGALGTPRSFRIDDIGDDYLLGVFRDSLDVEHVRIHRVSKPRGG